MNKAAIPVVLIATLAALPAQAICVSGAKCVKVPESQKTPPRWVPGDILEPGSYQMILNAPHYRRLDFLRRSSRVDGADYDNV